jgi:hypothetical protein
MHKRKRKESKNMLMVARTCQCLCEVFEPARDYFNWGKKAIYLCLPSCLHHKNLDGLKRVYS